MNPQVDDSLRRSMNDASSAEQCLQAMFHYMRERGSSHYDESVTQLEHGLQAADLANKGNGTPAEIVASLLHDIGHFMTDEHDDQSDFLQEDWLHEEIGSELLANFFPPEVTEPIRLHVPAKRYLCSVAPSYLDALSDASKRSFELQGGKMTAEEISEFEAQPHFESAVKVRRWDDGAKVDGREVPDLETYTPILTQCLMHH